MVDQVFHCPGKFARCQCTDHTAAALQGMKGTAQFGERIAVGGIITPDRYQCIDLVLLLCRLFMEDLDNFRIPIGVDCLQGGNIVVRDRHGGRCSRRGCSLRNHCYRYIAGCLPVSVILRPLRPGRGTGITELVETLLCNIDRTATVIAVFGQLLDTVFDTADGIRQCIQVSFRQFALR